MPLTALPSLEARTSPVKLATAPTSVRPRVSASSSRPVSKSSAWMRTEGISAAGDRGKERHFVTGLERRGKVGHLLVHRDAPLLAGGERLAPAAIARAQAVEQRRDGRICGGQ